MHICSNASESIIKQKAQLSTRLFQNAAHVLQNGTNDLSLKKYESPKSPTFQSFYFYSGNYLNHSITAKTTNKLRTNLTFQFKTETLENIFKCFVA